MSHLVESDLGAVVVAYNSSGILPDLLESISKYEPDARVVIVDNGSPEGPPAVKSGMKLVMADENRGFSGGCNLGAAEFHESRPRYLAFLNPDVRLTGPSLTELCVAMESTPKCGISTGMLIDARGVRVPSAWGEPGLIRLLWKVSGFKLLGLRRRLAFLAGGKALTSARSLGGGSFEVDGFVVGGFSVVKWDCLVELGGFDESYFMSWDDADICRRARDLGWAVWQFECTPAVHFGSASSHGVQPSDWQQWYRGGALRYAGQYLGTFKRNMFRTILWVDEKLRFG